MMTLIDEIENSFPINIVGATIHAIDGTEYMVMRGSVNPLLPTATIELLNIETKETTVIRMQDIEIDEQRWYWVSST